MLYRYRDITTNTIEGFNWQLRKVTKLKTIFPSDDNLLKMLYLAMMDITKKWTGHRQDWGQIHSQLEIYFEKRLENHRVYKVPDLTGIIDMQKNGSIMQVRATRKSGSALTMSVFSIYTKLETLSKKLLYHPLT